MNATVIIVGDELESCLTACVLGRHGVDVTLLRRSTGLVGGLSTRGGLAYMDLTPEFIPPMMQSILNESGLKRVGLHAETADRVLRKHLAEANVTIVSGVHPVALPILASTPHPNPPLKGEGADPSPLLEKRVRERGGCLEKNETRCETITLTGIQDAHTQEIYTADFYIDTTPDATLARQAGVPALLGLGNLFGNTEALNALGVSPLFRIKGLDYHSLQNAEEHLRHRPDMPHLLATHMPWLTKEAHHALIERPTYAPESSDYLDILNNIIGVAYHHWRYGDSVAYEAAPFWVDGFNIARLSDNSLSFNGLITRLPLAEQVNASEEGQPPTLAMRTEMQAFVDFLQEITTIQNLTLLPPEEIYIRQSYILEAQENITGRDLFLGGVHTEQSIGTFSYWLDFRGIHPWKAYPDLHPLPKPVFNVGLKPHFPKHGTNFAFLGRSSGFSPLSQGACRIVQYGCIVGEALAHAVSIGFNQGIHPQAVEASLIYEAQTTLARALGVKNPPKAGGKSTLTEALANSALIAKDEAIVYGSIAPHCF